MKFRIDLTTPTIFLVFYTTNVEKSQSQSNDQNNTKTTHIPEQFDSFMSNVTDYNQSLFIDQTTDKSFIHVGRIILSMQYFISLTR